MELCRVQIPWCWWICWYHLLVIHASVAITSVTPVIPIVSRIIFTQQMLCPNTSSSKTDQKERFHQEKNSSKWLKNGWSMGCLKNSNRRFSGESPGTSHGLGAIRHELHASLALLLLQLQADATHRSWRHGTAGRSSDMDGGPSALRKKGATERNIYLYR